MTPFIFIVIFHYMSDIKSKPDEYWRQKLSPEQYHVLREKGTEHPYTGKYYANYQTGMYECAACGQPLFSSDAKFESGLGWPSFEEPVNLAHIELKPDYSYGMSRTEVLCKSCGSHLGHVFTGLPNSRTGKDYCINSCALTFKKQEA